jgi:hypothetical protein
MSAPDDPGGDGASKPPPRREPPRLDLAQARAERERIQREARAQAEAAPPAAAPVREHPALLAAAAPPAAQQELPAPPPAAELAPPPAPPLAPAAAPPPAPYVAPPAPAVSPPAPPPVPDVAPPLPPKPARVVAPPPELAPLVTPPLPAPAAILASPSEVAAAPPLTAPAAIVASPANAAIAPPPAAGSNVTTNTVSKPPKARVRRAQVVGAVLGFVSLAIPTWLALRSTTFREAGVGAFVAVFLAIVSLLAANVRLLLSRKQPRALGLAALAAGAGAAGLLIAALFAHAMHADAVLTRESDIVLEPGMKEHLIGEAQANGRAVALFGLLALPGFLIGMLDLALALGERRIAQSAAKLKGHESEPVFPAWLAIAGSSAAFLLGFVLDVWAVFKSVDEAPNPRAGKLAEIEEAAQRGGHAARVRGAREGAGAWVRERATARGEAAEPGRARQQVRGP